MEATRVPPSAWMTSQSRMMDRSPRASRSMMERRERPMRRWISWVRPLGLPLVTSRGVRVDVARGSMEYSAVTQPLPVLRRNGGTELSTLAAHKTWVLPMVMRTEPSAVFRKPGVISTGRISSAFLPSGRTHHQYHHDYRHNHSANQNHQTRYARFDL